VDGLSRHLAFGALFYFYLKYADDLAWMASMVNHFLRANEMRVRSEQCELSANHTISEKFAECYRLLAKNYKMLAGLQTMLSGE
jgi:hypothetical protein